MMSKCNKTITNLFRDFPVKHGVYIPRDRRTGYDAKLLAILKETEVHEWTHEEATYQIKHGGGFSPKFDPFYGELSFIKQSSKGKEKVQPSSLREFPENVLGQDRLTSESKRIYDSTNQKSLAFSRSQAPPTGSSKQLMNLERMYTDKNNKYGGELYDILSSKLLIFYDFCRKLGLEEDQYHNAYSSMLKNRASQFFYDSLVHRNYSFDKMVELTKAHFETEANKQEYLTLWRTTTLAKN